MTFSRLLGLGLMALGAALWLLWRSRHVPPIPSGYPDRVTAWQARYGHLSSWPNDWWGLVGWGGRLGQVVGFVMVTWPTLATARWSWPVLAVGVVIGIAIGATWSRAQWLFAPDPGRFWRPEPRAGPVDIFFPEGLSREQLSPEMRLIIAEYRREAGLGADRSEPGE
jgi:hypothetical protein